MLVILPFWSSFLLRVYAWIGFLKNNGVINNFLGLFGLPQITMLYTDFGVYVGIVYTYLPFMILPLYTNLVKLDDALLEASADLGARPFRTFLSVTLPLSMPGIIAGSMLVFIPAIGEYVIPTLLGGPITLMIGRVLWDEFFANRDWPTGRGGRHRHAARRRGAADVAAAARRTPWSRRANEARPVHRRSRRRSASSSSTRRSSRSSSSRSTRASW